MQGSRDWLGDIVLITTGPKHAGTFRVVAGDIHQTHRTRHVDAFMEAFKKLLLADSLAPEHPVHIRNE